MPQINSSMENRVVKICIVGPAKLFLSGIAIYTIRLANALCENHEVCVLPLRKLMPRFLYPGRKRIGKPLTKLEFSSSIRTYEGMDYNSLSTWIGAYKFLKKEKPQIILIPWWTCAVVYLLLFIKILNKFFIKAKMVLELHELTHPLEEKILPLGFYSRLTLTLLIKGLDGYIVHSKQDKEYLINFMHRDRNKISVIPHGLYDHYGIPLDKKQARAELKMQEEFVIFYFGIISVYKQVPLIIEAFNKLPTNILQQSRLLIMGEEWGKKVNIYKLIKESPYPEKITAILRHPNDDDILKYFSTCDVVVLPYQNIHRSGVLTMAMSFGKPIILTQNDFPDEPVLRYEGNLFIDFGNSTQITNRIVEIFLDGRKTYPAPDLKFDKLASRFDNFFESLLVKGK